MTGGRPSREFRIKVTQGAKRCFLISPGDPINGETDESRVKVRGEARMNGNSGDIAAAPRQIATDDFRMSNFERIARPFIDKRVSHNSRVHLREFRPPRRTSGKSTKTTMRISRLPSACPCGQSTAPRLRTMPLWQQARTLPLWWTRPVETDDTARAA